MVAGDLPKPKPTTDPMAIFYSSVALGYAAILMACGVAKMPQSAVLSGTIVASWLLTFGIATLTPIFLGYSKFTTRTVSIVLVLESVAFLVYLYWRVQMRPSRQEEQALESMASRKMLFDRQSTAWSSDCSENLQSQSKRSGRDSPAFDEATPEKPNHCR